MKYKTYLNHIFILFSSCLLVSCAGSQEAPEGDDYALEERGSDCISNMTVRDYRVLDESNLIVTAGVQRKYHVVLSRRAFGLRSTWQIGFKSATGRICPRFSDIVVNDGLGPETIRISSINLLTPEDEEDLLIRFGKKEPETPQTPATEEVEGAEVEELD